MRKYALISGTGLVKEFHRKIKFPYYTYQPVDKKRSTFDVTVAAAQQAITKCLCNGVASASYKLLSLFNVCHGGQMRFQNPPLHKHKR